LQRWANREFLELERNIARQWRRSLASINFEDMVKTVRAVIGPWRKPKTLEDAKKIADTIIDYVDPEWLLRFGMAVLGVPEATTWVIKNWKEQRRPPLRDHMPYFIFLLTINIFFCLVLPTELLRNVKPSHQVDLAYLYYLPFCTVFTSRDRFHTQIVPLFLDPFQTFVHGDDLKKDLQRLDDLYAGLSHQERKGGLITFAAYPPQDTTFLTTQLWDKYLPRWRNYKADIRLDLEAEKQLVEKINQLYDSPDLKSHDEHDVDKLTYVTIQRSVKLHKGKYQRFSEETEQEIREKKKPPLKTTSPDS
jgi:hypothetical protein